MINSIVKEREREKEKEETNSNNRGKILFNYLLLNGFQYQKRMEGFLSFSFFFPKSQIEAVQ